MKEDVTRKTKLRPPRFSAADRRKFPFLCAILALPLIHIAVFFFYQNFSAILLAFQDSHGNYTLDTLAQVLRGFREGGNTFVSMNPSEALRNSFLIWINMHVVGFAVAIVTSFMLTKHMIGSRFFRVIYVLPGIVGGVVFSTIMKDFYSYNGIVTTLLLNAGADLPDMVLVNGLLGSRETAFTTLMVQIFILTVAGGDMIMAGAYMRIPEEIFESAKIEGAGFFREVFQFAIPCAWPTISTILIFALCSVFTADYSFYLYANGNETLARENGLVSIGYYLYSMQVNMSVSPRPDLYVYASAFGMCLTVITIPVVVIMRKILLRLVEPVEF